MKRLRLVKASQQRAAHSYLRFKAFLDAHPNPFVSSRPELLIQSAIADESLFFVENDHGDVVATTCFYRHGDDDDLWGELGSTLVDDGYKGFQLQPVMYKHIISLKWLSDWPNHLIAVVDERAESSYKNVERCGFLRQQIMPQPLIDATPGRNWMPVVDAKKRLYILPEEAVAESLMFVASNGQEHPLKNRAGAELFTLTVEFSYLREENAKAVLEQEAHNILGKNLAKKVEM